MIADFLKNIISQIAKVYTQPQWFIQKKIPAAGMPQGWIIF